jgi:hypothetical protein
MKECASKCYIHHIPCAQSDCRLHLDYEDDLNCTEIAVYKHGPMTLQQIGDRHGVSIVRAKQKKILFKTAYSRIIVRSFAECPRKHF